MQLFSSEILETNFTTIREYTNQDIMANKC